MKILIQHNFTSGLGDFMKNLASYMDALLPMKNMGYEINLYINLYKNCYVDKPFFKKLFSDDVCNFFDNITESIHSIGAHNYEEYKYHRSSHNPQSPGVHQWDVFFDGEPINFDIKYIEARQAYDNKIFYEKLPTFSNEITERVNNFLDKNPKFNFLHVRTSDTIDANNERYDKIVDKILSISKDTELPFYLGTNNQYIYEKLKIDDKIIVYDFPSFSKYSNDMNGYKNLHSINDTNDDILLNRLFDIAAEMVLVSHSNEIYTFNDYSWISQFLFYPICLRRDTIKLTNINI